MNSIRVNRKATGSRRERAQHGGRRSAMPRVSTLWTLILVLIAFSSSTLSAAPVKSERAARKLALRYEREQRAQERKKATIQAQRNAEAMQSEYVAYQAARREQSRLWREQESIRLERTREQGAYAHTWIQPDVPFEGRNVGDRLTVGLDTEYAFASTGWDAVGAYTDLAALRLGVEKMTLGEVMLPARIALDDANAGSNLLVQGGSAGESTSLLATLATVPLTPRLTASTARLALTVQAGFWDGALHVGAQLPFVRAARTLALDARYDRSTYAALRNADGAASSSLSADLGGTITEIIDLYLRENGTPAVPSSVRYMPGRVEFFARYTRYGSSAASARIERDRRETNSFSSVSCGAVLALPLMVPVESSVLLPAERSLLGEERSVGIRLFGVLTGKAWKGVVPSLSASLQAHLPSTVPTRVPRRYDAVSADTLLGITYGDLLTFEEGAAAGPYSETAVVPFARTIEQVRIREGYRTAVRLGLARECVSCPSLQYAGYYDFSVASGDTVEPTADAQTHGYAFLSELKMYRVSHRFGGSLRYHSPYGLECALGSSFDIGGRNNPHSYNVFFRFGYVF